MSLRGKWAEGIVPRNFSWVIKDSLAVCERPGGYGVNHRRVRRMEEIIWLRQQGFDVVVSLIPAPHNLHNYDELDVAWRHRPFGVNEPLVPFLGSFYAELAGLVGAGQRIVVHGEEVGDRVGGLLVGYVLWTGLVTEPPQAVSIVERILGRQIGPQGREIVTVAERLAAERAEA